MITVTADRVMIVRSFFGNAAPSQAIISARWRCNGNERELLSCPQDSRSYDHDGDAGVFCYGKIMSLRTYSIVTG